MAQVRRARLIRPTTARWQPSEVVPGTVDQALAVLSASGPVVVLTGAGMSTDSGIPDYRGPNAVPATPMLFHEFVESAANRRRYWARNYRGWAHLHRAEPNPAHLALARWERIGVPAPVVGVITQNVDGLHEAAGSRRLLALHGRGSDVVCLRCGAISGRAGLQDRLAELNPGVDPFEVVQHAELRPDADAEVGDTDDFVVADCLVCGGVLKPDVTFFGETVPTYRVEQANDWCDRAGSMLVAGSSLTVMSGFRFARSIVRQGKPLVIVNRGATRGDTLATVKLDASVAQVLDELVDG